MKDKTIMVVEDRGNTLKVISAILEDEGYHVLKATSGRQALETFNAHPSIQAVLSDLKMPGMDGLALFKQMQAIRRPPPFIIMTAYGTVKSAVQALKEGVVNYLIKPLDYDELIIVLEKVIHDHSLSQELQALKASIDPHEAFHEMIGADKNERDFRARAHGGAHRCIGADLWGNRHGQGTPGPGDSSGEPAS